MPTADTQSPRPYDAPVLTLEQVEQREFQGVQLAVLGQPIHHSISPQMHNAALAELAATDPAYAQWTYHRVEVPPARLAQALDLLSEKGFRGVNLTIPHKVHALDYVRSIDPAARVLGAVNTLHNRSGAWTGFNTDGYGFKAAVREELGVELEGRDVIILGAGGAARAIGAQCLTDGCRSVWIGNRSQERLHTLMQLLQPVDGAGRLHGFDLEQPPFSQLPADPLIVNATSLGLREDDPAPFALAEVQGRAAVYDTTYGAHASRLIRDARTLGLKAANGLSMLVWQGARSLEIWTGGSVPVKAMRQAATKALSQHA